MRKTLVKSVELMHLIVEMAHFLRDSTAARLGFGGVRLSLRRGRTELVAIENKSVSWMEIKDVQIRTTGRLCAEEDVLMHKLKKLWHIMSDEVLQSGTEVSTVFVRVPALARVMKQAQGCRIGLELLDDRWDQCARTWVENSHHMSRKQLRTTNAEAKRVAWSSPLMDLIDRLGGEADL